MKFVVLCLVALALSFMADVHAANLSGELAWKTLESGVSIPAPPAGHPRVFLRASDIPGLRERVKSPLLGPVWEHLQGMAGRSAQHRITIDAVRYLLEPDRELGRRTIETALDTLRHCAFGEISDVSRDMGRLMIATSIVYDWCYELLTEQEKKEFVGLMIKVAGQFEIGYPIQRPGSLTGHIGEWMIHRDMLAAGLALYDEYPDMYNFAAEKIFGSLIPARNWFYPGGAYHQGVAYGDSRFGSELYPLWIFDRLGAGNVYHPSQQFVPYWWIYMRRPDGKMMTNGDDFIWTPKLSSLLTASYYHDGYILADYLKDEWDWEYLKHANHPLDELFELLWRDPELQPWDITELPLTRYFGTPFGWMVARTGWGDDAVICEMKVSEWNFGNHQHLDGGAFQVYYKGPLAIDSGIYEGTDGGYLGPHNVNYYKRTIAHNSLLVFDPKEEFVTSGFQNVEKLNDGGQRMPNRWISAGELNDFLARDYKTGQVLGRWFGPDQHQPDFSYLKGDITEAYTDKVKQMQRSFVFINRLGGQVPAVLAVFDRVTSSDPSFRKYWLLHSMEKPQVKGANTKLTLTQRGWSGALHNTTLLPLPDNTLVELAGGPGHEFDVFGTNMATGIPPNHDPNDYELGEWRVQISPKKPAATDLMLNVMQVTGGAVTSVPDVEMIEADGLAGFALDGYAVLFHTGEKATDRPLTFTLPRSGAGKVLVCGLAAGTWQVRRDGAVTLPAAEIGGETGVLYFEGQAGAYQLLR